MAIAISRTSPLRRLQQRIGSATYRLNTVLVGLALVAEGGLKPSHLAVSWAMPPTPQKALQVTNQAEIFACSAAIVFATDVFDQFLRDITNEDWLVFSDDAKNIANKTKTRSKNAGGYYSIAERTEAILNDLNLPIGPAVAGIELLSKWRNIVVHTADRPARLESRFRDFLSGSKDHFHKHYSHLDIELAIANFERRRTPVPKEATSLIAVAQNMSRSIDEAAIKRAAGTLDLIEDCANNLLVSYFGDPDRTIPAWIELSEMWQGPLERRRVNLLKIMQRVGLSDTSSPVSACLSEQFLRDLISLDRNALADRLRVSPPKR